MNMCEVPSFYGSRVSTTTLGLWIGSTAFGKSPTCQPATSLSEWPWPHLAKPDLPILIWPHLAKPNLANTGHPCLPEFGQFLLTEFGQTAFGQFFIFVGWVVRCGVFEGPKGWGPRGLRPTLAKPTLAILIWPTLAKPTLAKKIWPTLANLNWPTLAKIGVVDFGQTDFVQVYCFSIFLFFLKKNRTWKSKHPFGAPKGGAPKGGAPKGGAPKGGPVCYLGQCHLGQALILKY